MDQSSVTQQKSIEILKLGLNNLHLQEQDKSTDAKHYINNEIDINLDNVYKLEENLELLDDSGTHQHHYPVDKTLYIDLILFEIQRNLTDLSDLLHFRQVCQQWQDNIASTSVIVKRCRKRELKFLFRKSSNSYNQVGRQNFTLGRFNHVFQNCSNLPFSFFSLENGSFATPDAKEFLSLYGQHVTTLRWRIRPSYLPLEDKDNDLFLRRTIGSFRRLLTINVSNLEHLILEGTPRQWDLSYEELFPSPARLLELPKLKIITFGDEVVCTPIMEEILSVANNLERIEGVEIVHLDQIMKWAPSKVYAIKDFCFGHLFSQFQIEECKTFANLKPQLERIQINYADTFQELESEQRTQLGTIISQILESSQETLKKIMLCPMAYLPEFKFPVLFNVEEIFFHDSEAIYGDPEITTYRMMPEGQRLTHIFPGVTRVKFDMKVFKDSFHDVPWSDIFGRGECLSSCKSVKIFDATGNSYTTHWFKNIAKLLPNLENFHIITFDLEEAAWELFREIWTHFSKIRTLKFQMRVLEYGQNFFSVMDSAFTGIDRGRCINLSQKSTKLSVEEVDKFRTNPSILDLHDLKSLTMEFDVRFANHYRNDGAVSPLFSISGLYALAPIKIRQNVRIRVSTFYPTTEEKISGLRIALRSVMDCVDAFETQVEDERDCEM